MPLDGGGEVLFETVAPFDAGGIDGPVPAGRVADALREMPASLQQGLAPVREMAGAVVAQLREAGPVGPAEVEVEFGLNLSAQAGAVISKGGVTAHLKVRVLWKAGSDADGKV
ncbi:CU044_2847 family protein [Nocardiopsis trehalosi]|uniref:CU044_2847 family protein n=1 Tax=Nocardiopsis trehalosi TaxID=109329 RepID=UPI001C3F30C5|nr:CU044_2847 family protein [Nocardiopsis trehalosi]